MVGWIYWTGERRWRPRVEPQRVLGLPLLAVGLPAGGRGRRLRQGARALLRQGARRALAAPGFDGWEELREAGVSPVDPLPLCRAKGAGLALALLEHMPERRRAVALRGGRADETAWALAEELCPRVGALLLDLDRGEEELAAHLRGRYGAAPLHLGQGPAPAVSLELSPRNSPAGTPLRLWGEPELAGLTLGLGQEELPRELEPLPLLELLWETGRRTLEEITILPGRKALDRTGENTYNTG
ncbi:hypothetical protein CE91St43_10390 [Oscillospiraceae bacterium]|nr:hypothetical protein CE91St43_10390 [Oscillospiraceae bacterium]